MLSCCNVVMLSCCYDTFFIDQLESSPSEGGRGSSRARSQGQAELIDLTSDETIVVPCSSSTWEGAEGDREHPLLRACRDAIKQAQRAFGRKEVEDVEEEERKSQPAAADCKEMVIEIAERAGRILSGYLETSGKFRFLNVSHVDCAARCRCNEQRKQEETEDEDLRSYLLQFDAGWHLSQTSW